MNLETLTPEELEAEVLERQITLARVHNGSTPMTEKDAALAAVMEANAEHRRRVEIRVGVR